MNYEIFLGTKYYIPDESNLENVPVCKFLIFLYHFMTSAYFCFILLSVWSTVWLIF